MDEYEGNGRNCGGGCGDFGGLPIWLADGTTGSFSVRAGMDTVMTELQRQLDAWIAEHPDWDPLGRN